MKTEGDFVRAGNTCDNAMMTISLKGNGYQAYLVVDSALRNTSSGGVRIAPDITLAEVTTLAREMSLKYALFRLPRGGAKTGIALETGMTHSERQSALLDVGRKLGPIIRLGLYSPGMDLNCGPEELKTIYRGAGIQIGPPTDTSYFTALSVANAVEACYEESGDTRPWTIAVEGFGRVAGHLAEQLSPDKYRIVALSTLAGAVRNEGGFDAKLLASERARVGDDFVTHLGGEPIELSQLFLEPVDLLLPSTRTWAITSSIAHDMRARTIVPIANAPYEEGVVQYLHSQGTLCLPGYVSNAGGVFASSLYDSGLSRMQVELLVARHYRPVVRLLLNRSRTANLPPPDIAEGIANRELEARASGNGSKRLASKIARKFEHRLPRSLRARSARNRFVVTMAARLKELEDGVY